MSSQLFLVPCISLGLSDQQIFDCVIQQELLAEVVELFAHKLVQLLHDFSQDTNSMGPDGVEHLIDSDCLELFCFGSLLNENLLMKIVMVLANIFLCLTE